LALALAQPELVGQRQLVVEAEAEVAVLVFVILAVRQMLVVAHLAGLPEAEQVERAAFIQPDRKLGPAEVVQILLAQAAAVEVGQSRVTISARPLAAAVEVEEVGLELAIPETPEIRERQLIQRHITPFQCHREQVTRFR
jgi:hypothetical protein